MLRVAAEEDDNDQGRLVLADWLEARGDAARAEFIRVQCELARFPRDLRPMALREREYELLLASREAWCAELRVAVEDVRFHRGLVTAVRLASWDRARFLDPAVLGRFVTLTELDLSGLGLQDADLAAFADAARFPCLRNLFLGVNRLSDEGAYRLAEARGLPRLKNVHLFDNAVTRAGATALSQTPNFALATIDLGERAVGREASPGQTDMKRREYLRTRLGPYLQNQFQTYERLRSAMLCVAQYWNDEADDAVHSALVVSEGLEPTLTGVGYRIRDDEGRVADPNIPNTTILGEWGLSGSSMISTYRAGGWDDNNSSIPLWACFAPEGGHQQWEEVAEVYAPAVLFYRHGEYEVLPMARPHLDGVRPLWSRDGDE